MYLIKKRICGHVNRKYFVIQISFQRCTGVQNTRDCSFTPMFGQIQKPILSARIVSKISFRFGRIHIKAKLPCGLWLYPGMFICVY